MSTRYFKKEQHGNVINWSDGSPIKFEPCQDDNGVLVLDDPDKIAQLLGFIAKRRGGVMEITKDDYEAEKKKTHSTTPRRPLRDTAPRLYDPNKVDPFKNYSKPPELPDVLRAAVQGSAAPVAGNGTAPVVAGQATSNNLRVGKPKAVKKK